MSRHRIFLVPTRADLAVDEAIDHWELHHPAVFAATPELAGYVQHRPTRAEQARLGGRVCAEAWFRDREAEACGFGSAHYRGAVTEDEDRFVDRSRAWAALVREESVVGPPGRDAAAGAPGEAFEVVAVGCDPGTVPAGIAARVLGLDRPGPAGGPATVVIAEVADEAAGRALAEALVADVSFLARRTPVLPPPG